MIKNVGSLTLEWRYWPLKDEGAKGWLKTGLVLILAGGLWLVLTFSLPILVASLLSLSLIIAVLPYFLPTFYRVGADGVAVRRGWSISRQRSWQLFRYYNITPKGFLLMPETENQAALTQFRSLFLPYPPEESARQILTAFISERLTP